MAQRSQRQETKHNNTIQDSAEYYKKQGYNVQADISGYDKPKTIQGKRPDLIASKKGEKVILEIETLDSFAKDKKQRTVFKEYADGRKKTRFWTKIAK